MAISFNDYIQMDVEVEEGTLGGDTYWIGGRALCFAYTTSHIRAVRTLTSEKSSDFKQVNADDVEAMVKKGILSLDTSGCVAEYGILGARVFDSEKNFVGEVGIRCAQIAGAGTDHKGNGRCKFHSGNRKTAGLVHGRSSIAYKRNLIAKIEEFTADPQYLDLRHELAVQRTMLETITDRLYETEDEKLAQVAGDIIRMADVIGKQVERIVTIDQKYAITASQVMYLETVVRDILTSHIKDARELEDAIKDLAERMGVLAVREASNLIPERRMK